MDIDSAIEVFVRGFGYTRSLTHPYLVERIGKLWRLHDGPRTSGDRRNEEWVACGVAPAQVDRAAREHAEGRYAICAVQALTEDGAPLRAAYGQLGYRLLTNEPLMVQALQKIPRCPAPNGVELQRVLSQVMADRLAKAARARQIFPEHLQADAPLRQYIARSGDELVGWVRSITVALADDLRATWCSNMYVEPEYRRRGIARAMLCKMLRDDRAAGSGCGVLSASHAGAKLYPIVGYHQIGTLLVFVPRRK